MNSTTREPVRPGTILNEEFMIPFELTQDQLAEAIGVERRRVNEIIGGKRKVTSDTAMRLSRFFGTTVCFWLSLQAKHDIWKVHQSEVFLKELSEIKPVREDTAVLAKVIEQIKASGLGYESVSITPVLSPEKTPMLTPTGKPILLLKVECKPGEMEAVDKALNKKDLNFPYPIMVCGEPAEWLTSSKPDPENPKKDENVFHLFNLTEREPISYELAAKIVEVLGLPDTAEMLDYVSQCMEDPESEPLVSHVSLDEAVRLMESLMAELEIESVIMIDCEGCSGVGGWSAVNGRHETQDPDCGCCKGRGVQYLPEAE